jgi:hypothetical protein
MITYSECWLQRHWKHRGLETLLFPHPGPGNREALARGPVQLVTGSAEGQYPTHLMTDHQEG